MNDRYVKINGSLLSEMSRDHDGAALLYLWLFLSEINHTQKLLRITLTSVVLSARLFGRTDDISRLLQLVFFIYKYRIRERHLEEYYPAPT